MILSSRVCFQGWGLGREGFGEWGIGEEAHQRKSNSLKQVLRSIKARYYIPGCSHRLVNVLVSVVIGRPFYELPT